MNVFSRVFTLLILNVLGFTWVSGQDYQAEIQQLKTQLSATSDPFQQATLLNDLSYAYRRVSVDSVLRYGEMALAISTQFHDLRNQAYAYKNIGISMYKRGSDHQKTLTVNKKALELAKAIEDYPLQAGCLNNIGLVYHTIFQLETSLTYYFEGLALYETHISENDFRKGLLLANIAITYHEMEDFEKGLQYLEEVMQYAEEHHHPRLYIIYCDNYANALMMMNQLDEAQKKCQECLSVTSSNHDLHSHLQSNLTYAKILFEQQRFQDAIFYAQQGYTKAVENHFHIVSAKSLLMWARALQKLGNIELAIQKATEAYETSIQLDKFWQSGQIARFLSDLHKEQENYKTALEYQSWYNHWSKKEKDTHMKYHVAELDAKYQNENHRNQIELLRKEKELNQQTNALYKMGIGLLSLALLMGIYVYFNKRKAMKQLAGLNQQLNDAQENLKWKNDELQTIVNFAQEGITHKEFHSGKCISCNPKALQIYGAKDVHEIMHVMSENMFFTPDQKHQSFDAVFAELMQELKENGKYEGVHNFRMSGGKVIRVFIVSILDTSRADNHKIISFHKDITKEVEAKEALKKRNIDLQKYIESNIQLEQFAHIASHDLRAPIITINSFSKLLRTTAIQKLNPNEQEYLELIQSNSQQILELVTDLLEYSKINSQKINLEHVNTNCLVNHVITSLTNQAQEKDVIIMVAEPLPLLKADSIKLKRVFQNLISNALKFSDPTKKSRINIDVEETPDFWKFQVKDNGIGIQRTDIDIFQPYTQLNRKSDYKGSGMGLSFCKKIVEQHGGEIGYESTYEQGSTFFFTIPKQKTTHSVKQPLEKQLI